MDIRFVILAALLFPLDVYAQKHDNNWLFGLNSNSNDPGYGTAVINFDNGFNVDTFHSPINFQETAITMSDSIGNLLFYSNGLEISNWQGDLIEGGDGINANCQYFEYTSHVGLNFSQSILCLPHPGQEKIYSLFHFEHRYDPGVGIRPIRLLTTKVDMGLNQGEGKVIEKNKVVLNGDFDGISAVKHGNGQDWWIVMPSDSSGLFYTILFDESGLYPQDEQILYRDWTGRFNPNLRDRGWNQFTSDGKKFINNQNFFGLRIMDFDRCTGVLSNSELIDLDSESVNFQNRLPFHQWSARYPGNGFAISPNSRFAYTSNYRWIIQYDLEADDIRASRTVVAEYDGFQSPWGGQFYSMQLMPDGKIYINCGNSENVMHVINQPNLKGIACDLQQHAVQLPVFNLRTMPYFPNYRLYDLADSPCDTLSIDTPVSTTEIVQKAIERAKVFPNPTSGNVTVEFENMIEENYQFVLYNAIGQQVFITQLSKGQKQQQLTFPKLSSGIYYYGIGLDGGFVFRTGKLILE